MGRTRSGRVGIDFYGTPEILKRLEALDRNVHEIVQKAVQVSAEPVASDMQSYMSGHRLTGQTEASWDEECQWHGDVLAYKIGYSIRKGGIAAVFLNVGTPRIRPSAFIDKAIDHNLDKIKDAQLKVLREALEG